jgi:hypothetical protein
VHEVFISHNTLEVDLFFNGKIRNISNRGMSFESDCPFYPNETIKVKIPGIIDSTEIGSLRPRHATVKWSKTFQYSTFQNCCGVEFTESLKDIEKFILPTEAIKQSSFSSNILAISGIAVFFVYYLLKIFFDLKPVSDQFELIIIGFGLLGSVQFIKGIAKASKIGPKKTK